MTIWGPVISLVLITNPDGFPRQPDRTQSLHAFRANPGAAQSQSTQWIAAAAVQQVAELEFEVRRSKPDQLHLYRQAFQTVGQSWALWPKPSNRVEAEGFTQPVRNYAPFFGRAAQSQPSQPWSAYKWTSPVPDIQEYRPQWTDHNAAYAPFRGRVGLVANQPWSAYRWSIPTPETAPYVEYRSRDFWADYLPFTLTPTSPAPPPDVGGSNPGGGGGGRSLIWSGKFEFSARKHHANITAPPKRTIKPVSSDNIAELASKLSVKSANIVNHEITQDDDEEAMEHLFAAMTIPPHILEKLKALK